VSALTILIGKPGLDGHDRGAKVVARALEDAGMSVVYTGLHRSAAQIAQAAADSDADAVGLSILSGAHMTLVPAVLSELDARGLGHIPVFAGGIIPKDDAAALIALGVRRIFAPGSPVHSVVDWVSDNVRPHTQAV
jgi:methylmalonyl-CoA mutase C-terminal domain/subunit